jgi:DNA-binding IclR family transcriptional regulator
MVDWVEIEKKILDVIRSSDPNSLSTYQIGQLAQIHHSTAMKHLKLMEFHGIVEKVTNGRITLWTLRTE